MRFVIDIPDHFDAEDPEGVIHSVREALEFAAIPATVTGQSGAEEGIIRVLDCSCAHVSPKDMELLGEVAGEGRSTELLAYPLEYGALVYVPGADELAGELLAYEDYLALLRQDGFSESFIKVLEFAAARNCTWVKLDGSGRQWGDLDFITDRLSGVES